MFKNKFDERYAKKKKMSITVVFSPGLYNSELFAFRLLLKKKTYHDAALIFFLIFVV